MLSFRNHSNMESSLELLQLILAHLNCPTLLKRQLKWTYQGYHSSALLSSQDLVWQYPQNTSQAHCYLWSSVKMVSFRTQLSLFLKDSKPLLFLISEAPKYHWNFTTTKNFYLLRLLKMVGFLLVLCYPLFQVSTFVPSLYLQDWKTSSGSKLTAFILTQTQKKWLWTSNFQAHYDISMAI